MTATMDFHQTIRIVLGNGAEFGRPEERIREYCEIEVYRDVNYRGGYDDHLNLTDSLTNDDLEAANNLYANLDSLDRRRLLGSPEIPKRLAPLKDSELGEMKDEGWEDAKALVRPLFSAFLSIPNITLAKTTKVLHLKRPHFLPVLDSFVVKFLTGNDMAKNPFTEEELLKIGLTCLDIARSDLVKNREAFAELQSSLADLATPLASVRLYDILCRTQEKWVNQGNPHAKYGTATRSLSQRIHLFEAPLSPVSAETMGRDEDRTKPLPGGEIKSTKEFRQVKLRAEGVIVNTSSSPPRAHRPLCTELTEERFHTAVIFNEGKGGKYYLRSNLAEAVRDFGAVACKKCRPERPVRQV
jgi:hypothetical protein